MIVYIKNCLSVSDRVTAVLTALAATFIGMMIPRITKALTGPILQKGEISALLGVTVCIICVAAVSNLIKSVSGLLIQKLKTKTSVSVEAALMMRVLSLPAPFFRQYSAGELTKRSQSVNVLCTLIMGMVYSTGLSSLVSLLYITQIFSFAPSLVIPSLLMIRKKYSGLC